MHYAATPAKTKKDVEHVKKHYGTIYTTYQFASFFFNKKKRSHRSVTMGVLIVYTLFFFHPACVEHKT